MLITEKEKKIKEGMKMMGLTDFAFYLSWIIYYTVIYSVIAGLWTLIMLVLWKSSTGILVFVWYWLYCMTLVPLALLVCVFFSKARIGIIAALVFYLALFIFSFLDDAEMPASTKMWMYLAP